jgi:hypothetical protein
MDDIRRTALRSVERTADCRFQRRCRRFFAHALQLACARGESAQYFRFITDGAFSLGAAGVDAYIESHREYLFITDNIRLNAGEVARFLSAKHRGFPA